MKRFITSLLALSLVVAGFAQTPGKEAKATAGEARVKQQSSYTPSFKNDGKDKTYYVYNVCDHQECYKEVGSQAISYTTGVPAMIGAMMILTKTWSGSGVFNVEEFDPDPFMDALNKWGLPWVVEENPETVE